VEEEGMTTRERGRPRVLVVDDDPNLRLMLGDALQGAFEVVTAASNAEALHSVRQKIPDAIVLDLSLGAESGWDFLRALQGDPRLDETQTVVLSGSRVTHSPAGLGPCAAYVQKPFPVQQLGDMLSRLIEQRPRRQL
jgi:CheY-like chemotaxis protein